MRQHRAKPGPCSKASLAARSCVLPARPPLPSTATATTTRACHLSSAKQRMVDVVAPYIAQRMKQDIAHLASVGAVTRAYDF